VHCVFAAADVRDVVEKDVIPAYAGTNLTPSVAFGSGVQFRWSKQSDTVLGMNGRGWVGSRRRDKRVTALIALLPSKHTVQVRTSAS
jgi:hypothetical protein